MPQIKRNSLQGRRGSKSSKSSFKESPTSSDDTESSSDFVTVSKKKTKSSSYIVEKIVDKRPLYLVKWLGFPNSENTWEPIENLSSCTEMIQDFEAGRAMVPEAHPEDYSSTSENEFLVEKILKKKFEYQVKYKGFPNSANEWQLEETLTECTALIKAFEEQRKIVEASTAGAKKPQTAPTEPDRKPGKKSGFDLGWIPLKIHGVSAEDEDLFVMQWKGLNTVSLVPRHEANTKCPQVVIAYYESCVEFIKELS